MITSISVVRCFVLNGLRFVLLLVVCVTFHHPQERHDKSTDISTHETPLKNHKNDLILLPYRIKKLSLPYFNTKPLDNKGTLQFYCRITCTKFQ